MTRLWMAWILAAMAAVGCQSTGITPLNNSGVLYCRQSKTPQQQSAAEGKSRTQWGSGYFGVLAPTTAKYKKLDPYLLWGGSYFFAYTSGTGMGEITANIAFGKGEQTIFTGWAFVEEDFEDDLFSLWYKSIFFLGDKKLEPFLGPKNKWESSSVLNHTGLIIGAGVGYEAAGAKDCNDGLFFAVGVGIGYWASPVNVRIELIGFPSSGNVTSALSLSAGIQF